GPNLSESNIASCRILRGDCRRRADRRDRCLRQQIYRHDSHCRFGRALHRPGIKASVERRRTCGDSGSGGASWSFGAGRSSPAPQGAGRARAPDGTGTAGCGTNAPVATAFSTAPSRYVVGAPIVFNVAVADADLPTCGADFTIDWKFLQVPIGSGVTTVIPPFA